MDPLLRRHLARKISGETEYLAEKTKLLKNKISSQNRPRGSLEKFFEFKGWGWIGVILTLAITSFGFFETLSNYFEREANRNAFALDKDIISLVADKSSQPEQRAIMVNLLSYYEYNSLPVIVYVLEQETSDVVRKEIEKSLLRMTVHSEKKGKIIDELIASFEVFGTMVDPTDNSRFYNFKTYLNLFKDDIFKTFTREKQCDKIINILENLRTRYSKDTLKYERYLKELDDKDIEKYKYKDKL